MVQYVPFASVEVGDIDVYGQVIRQTPQSIQPPSANHNQDIQWFIYFVEGSHEPKYESDGLKKGHFRISARKPKPISAEQAECIIAYIQERMRTHPIKGGTDLQTELIDSGLLESIMNFLCTYPGKTLKKVLDHELTCLRSD